MSVKKKIEKPKCKNCGRRFSPRNRRQEYCNDSCRNRYNYKKLSPEKKEEYKKRVRQKYKKKKPEPKKNPIPEYYLRRGNITYSGSGSCFQGSQL